jgi:hypothetical protein
MNGELRDTYTTLLTKVHRAPMNVLVATARSLLLARVRSADLNVTRSVKLAFYATRLAQEVSYSTAGQET